MLCSWNNVYTQGVQIMATSGQNFTDPTIYNGTDGFGPYDTFVGRFDQALYMSQVKQASKFAHDCSAGVLPASEGFCTCALATACLQLGHACACIDAYDALLLAWGSIF